MKALIVKKIEIETRELSTSMPYYREAIHMGMSVVSLKEGEMPSEYSVTTREKVYERMQIHNPDTKEIKNYFVNIDDRHLWNEIIHVSDGFINQKINVAVRKFKKDFIMYALPKEKERTYHATVVMIKSIPWYKRLFNRF